MEIMFETIYQNLQQDLSEKRHFMTFKHQTISAFKVESFTTLASKALQDDAMVVAVPEIYQVPDFSS